MNNSSRCCNCPSAMPRKECGILGRTVGRTCSASTSFTTISAKHSLDIRGCPAMSFSSCGAENLNPKARVACLSSCTSKSPELSRSQRCATKCGSFNFTWSSRPTCSSCSSQAKLAAGAAVAPAALLVVRAALPVVPGLQQSQPHRPHSVSWSSGISSTGMAMAGKLTPPRSPGPSMRPAVGSVLGICSVCVAAAACGWLHRASELFEGFAPAFCCGRVSKVGLGSALLHVQPMLDDTALVAGKWIRGCQALAKLNQGEKGMS